MSGGRGNPAEGREPRDLRPEGASAPESEADAGAEPGAGPESEASPQAAGQDMEALVADVLRSGLRESVSQLEPAPDSLDRLHRAVPRRRARRRQAIGGAVALALLTGAAIPLVRLAGNDSVHIDQAAQPSGGYPSGLASNGTGAQGGSGVLTSPSGRSGSAVASLLPGGGSGVLRPVPGHGGGLSTGLFSLGGQLPECVRAQLGDGSAVVGKTNPDGTVYGYFEVANVSSSTCRVSGPGTVTVAAVQGTDPARIRVVAHTSSDPANQLPPPQSAPSSVVLQPQQAYQVDFGWVPDGSNGSACSGAPGGSSGTPGSAPSSASSSPSSSGGSGPSGSVSAANSPNSTTAGGASGSSSGTPSSHPSGSASDSSGRSPAAPASASPSGGSGSSTTGVHASSSGSGTSGSSGGSSGTPDTSESPSAASSPTPSQNVTVTLDHTPGAGGAPAAGTQLKGACSGTVYRTGPLPASGSGGGR